MSEGSGGPWTSAGAHISAPHDAAHAETAEPIERGKRILAFPTDRAERGIEMLSRIAGPVVFVLALAGIAWLLIK